MIIDTIDGLIRTDKIIQNPRKGIDVIHVQEGRQFTNSKGEIVDSVTPLKEYLETRDYKVRVISYNEGQGKNPSSTSRRTIRRCVVSKEGYVRYLTQTPDRPTDRSGTNDDIKRNNWVSSVERCVVISKFEHIDLQ